MWGVAQVGGQCQATIPRERESELPGAIQQ
jgi:hypothetical protein